MKPPFVITAEILNSVAEISRYIGMLGGLPTSLPSPRLRKQNKIKTIKSTLAIEGNILSEAQITAIMDGKKVLGKPVEITEVRNAIDLYDQMDQFNSSSLTSFKAAHKLLMAGIIDSAGRFRSGGVGIMKGRDISHIAPKAALVPTLINELLLWHKREKQLHPLIKGAILHYEIEFIHPFDDGNGRMGRFWQSLVLSEFDPLFRYLPVESLVERAQKKYYAALETADKSAESTPFVAFMLRQILHALREFVQELEPAIDSRELRLQKAAEHFRGEWFSRKEYLKLFLNISTATASRDLRDAVVQSVVVSKGNGNRTEYHFFTPE
ncbi:MAG: Fic family protein [Oligoflexales bacterium]|nr:Fic family protein [Oligoflexales bacterium]